MGEYIHILELRAELTHIELKNRKQKKSRYIGSCELKLRYVGIYYLAQWVGFEPTSLKGHHDFEQIIKLPIWSLIVLK